MISMPSESWLNRLCKHRYPDMILVQLTMFPWSSRRLIRSVITIDSLAKSLQTEHGGNRAVPLMNRFAVSMQVSNVLCICTIWISESSEYNVIFLSAFLKDVVNQYNISIHC